MRSRRPSPEHEQAVARRLASLNAQWDAARAGVTASGAHPVGQPDAQPDAQPAEVVEPGLARSSSPAPWVWEPHTRIRDAVLAPAVGAAPGGEAALTGTTVSVRTTGVEEAGVETPRVVDRVPVDGAVAVPVPGRHAARRAVGLSLGPLPLDRVGLRAAHLVWVGLFACLALAVSAWWVVRSQDVEVVTPLAASSAPTEPGGPATSLPSPGQPSTGQSAPVTAGGGTVQGAGAGAGAGAATEVVVDVAGKVRRPGLVVLPVGARVHDAIEAAGGPRRGVDLTPLNLARLLVDGEQIVVGAPAVTGPSAGGAAPGDPAAGGTGTPGTTAGGLVNLNTATPSELETLPGVGPVTAAAIVEWRTTHGGFTSVEDLLEVRGIGEVTLAQLSELVTV